jgi:hypothetical protein
LQTQHSAWRHRQPDHPAALGLPSELSAGQRWAHPPHAALTHPAWAAANCRLPAQFSPACSHPPTFCPPACPPSPQDMALSLVGALIDPSQPPSRWPLEELMWQLHGLVNADPFQQHHDTLGGWASG